jgi:hypothetical protein
LYDTFTGKFFGETCQNNVLRTIFLSEGDGQMFGICGSRTFDM